MHVNKWVTLSASALLQCSAGVSYCFSIYSSQLKDALGYNQAQIQGLASPLVALLVVGWLPGFVYDSLRRYEHIGPRQVVLAMPLQMLLGSLYAKIVHGSSLTYSHRQSFCMRQT